MTAAVSLRQISKWYGDTIAVDNISLDIYPGEFFFLLGPSGCGKTTTLRMISGFESPTRGRIVIDDVDSTLLPPEQRNTSMVFQNWALFPHKTVYENVAFGLRMRRLPKKDIERRTQQILEVVSLSGFENRFPHQLSGGQKQRVALARSLVVGPSVLLFDEPLSSLDLKLREKMRYELLRLHKKIRFTAIYVTHDQIEALTMADRIAVMNHGVLQQVDKPRRLYEKPATPFTAQFIGEANSWIGIVMEKVRENRFRVRKSSGLEIIVEKAGLTIGSKVQVFLRPEHIRMTASPSSRETTIPAEVQMTTFLGNLYRYSLLLPDGTELVAHQLADEQQMNVKSGRKVLVEVPASRCLVMPY